MGRMMRAVAVAQMALMLCLVVIAARNVTGDSLGWLVYLSVVASVGAAVLTVCLGNRSGWDSDAADAASWLTEVLMLVAFVLMAASSRGQLVEFAVAVQAAAVAVHTLDGHGRGPRQLRRLVGEKTRRMMARIVRALAPVGARLTIGAA